jgi:FAD:protein FMN transferase
MHHFILLFALLLSAYAQEVTRTKVMMGTFVTLSLPSQNKQHIKPLFEIIKAVDNSLSSFKTNSPIYKLNQNKYAKLDTYSYEALRLSALYYKKTGGYFNVAIGSITKGLYDFNSLQFDAKKAEISDNIKIDLGGMGKGFAVDKTVKYLVKHNIKKAKVAASGDIRCIGTCKIEVKNPFAKEALVTFRTKQASLGVSTSGNYEHFVKNKNNNHLINPKTKHPQHNFTSITLISVLPSSDLDAYTTAVSVMPKEKAFGFLKSLDVAFVILDSEKKLYVSENINKFVTDLIINDTFKKYPKYIKH